MGGDVPPPEALATVGRALAGRELAMPQTTRRVRPKPADLNRLRALHERAAQMANVTPDLLANKEVMRALESSLLHAMINCLIDGDHTEMTAGCRLHLAIVSRLEEFLLSNLDRPLYLVEVCAAIGASERTLRNSCNEHLGMGPINYLNLRHMKFRAPRFGSLRPANCECYRYCCKSRVLGIGPVFGRLSPPIWRNAV